MKYGVSSSLRFPKQYVRTWRLLSEVWGGTLPVCDYTSLRDASRHLSWPFLIVALPPEELRSPAPWWRWVRGRSGLCTHGPAGKTSALLLAPASMVGGGGGCITTGGWEEGWGTHQGGDPRCPVQASRSTHTHFFLQLWDRLDHECHPDSSACSLHRGMPLVIHSHAIFAQENGSLVILNANMHWASFKWIDSIQMNKGLFPELSEPVGIYSVFIFVLTT